MKLKITLAVAAAGMLGLIALAVLQEKSSHRMVIEIPKTRCVEICIETLQNKGVFPDFHSNMQQCDQMFGLHDFCNLASP